MYLKDDVLVRAAGLSPLELSLGNNLAVGAFGNEERLRVHGLSIKASNPLLLALEWHLLNLGLELAVAEILAVLVHHNKRSELLVAVLSTTGGDLNKRNHFPDYQILLHTSTRNSLVLSDRSPLYSNSSLLKSFDFEAAVR